MRPAFRASPHSDRPLLEASHGLLLTSVAMSVCIVGAPSQQPASPARPPVQFDALRSFRLPAQQEEALAFAHGDMDGDGDLDLVRATRRAHEVLLSDGQGSFQLSPGVVPADNRHTRRLCLLDADRDGDLDVFAVAGRQSSDRLLTNDGTGRLTDVSSTHLPAGVEGHQDVVAGDVDGDGDLDLIASGYSDCVLYRNDGRGAFVLAPSSGLSTPVNFDSRVTLGDIDGDGDLDAVHVGILPMGAYGYTRVVLFLNDGAGRFTASIPSLSPADHAAVALGDVDGDGDLDMVVATQEIFYGGGYPTGPHKDQLYLNDGTGGFVDATTQRLPGVAADDDQVELRDLDADGDLDIAFGRSGIPLRFHLNDGAGFFVGSPAEFCTAPLGNINFYSRFELADLDADGDDDLVFTVDRRDHMFANLRWQIDAPSAPRLGAPFRLDVYAAGGTAPVVETVLPFLSAATSSVPTPFGRLGIDLGRSVALAPFVIHSGSGFGSVTIDVPRDPLLAGSAVYAQALVVPFPGTARLSNVAVDVIR